MTAADRDALFARTKKVVGWTPVPRLDAAGDLIVGYGRRVAGMTISRDLGDAWLKDDLALAEAQCRGPFPWFDELASKRQAVIVELAFRITLERLRRRTRFLGALERGDHVTAAEELERTWPVLAEAIRS